MDIGDARAGFAASGLFKYLQRQLRQRLVLVDDVFLLMTCQGGFKVRTFDGLGPLRCQVGGLLDGLLLALSANFDMGALGVVRAGVVDLRLADDDRLTVSISFDGVAFGGDGWILLNFNHIGDARAGANNSVVSIFDVTGGIVAII